MKVPSASCSVVFLNNWQSLLAKQQPTINRCNQMYHLSISFLCRCSASEFISLLSCFILAGCDRNMHPSAGRRQQNQNSFVLLFLFMSKFYYNVTLKGYIWDLWREALTESWRAKKNFRSHRKHRMIRSELWRNLINWLWVWALVKFEFLWHKISENYYLTAHVLPAMKHCRFRFAIQ